MANSDTFIDAITTFFDAIPFPGKENPFKPRRGRQQVQYRQSNMYKSRSLFSIYWKDFVESKALNPNLNPASALTRQFEIHSPKLHEQFLINNGTSASDFNIQNFYINPFFQGRTTYLEPNEEFKFFDLIVFEPKVLQLKQTNLEMTLFVKTGSAPLQSINLTG